MNKPTLVDIKINNEHASHQVRVLGESDIGGDSDVRKNAEALATVIERMMSATGYIACNIGSIWMFQN